MEKRPKPFHGLVIPNCSDVKAIVRVVPIAPLLVAPSPSRLRLSCISLCYNFESNVEATKVSSDSGCKKESEAKSAATNYEKAREPERPVIRAPTWTVMVNQTKLTFLLKSKPVPMVQCQTSTCSAHPRERPLLHSRLALTPTILLSYSSEKCDCHELVKDSIVARTGAAPSMSEMEMSITGNPVQTKVALHSAMPVKA